jgi:hypothetical protein
MNRTLMCAAALAPAAGACKGETKVVDSPQTLERLSTCEKATSAKDDYIKQLHARIVELELASGGEVIVVLQGDAFSVSAGKGPSARASRPMGDEDDKQLYQSFIDSVNASRGGMKKCYENALKRDSSLQARTITLELQVRFSADGKAGRVDLDPRVSDAFDTCMQGLIRRWSLPAAPSAVTFRAPVTLTPQ